MPSPVVSCYGDNASRNIQYMIAVEAAGQGTRNQNYGALAALMDALEDDIEALKKSNGGTLANFLTYSIATGTAVNPVAGNEYWGIIADITVSDVPI